MTTPRDTSPTEWPARPTRWMPAATLGGAKEAYAAIVKDELASAQQRPHAALQLGDLVAIGQRKLDRPGRLPELEQRLDDVAALDAAARVAHRALVDGVRLASDLHRLAALNRMQLETEPERAPAAERLDAVGVQRARPGAGVDLGLDRADAKIRQPDPFAPADLERLFRGEACFHVCVAKGESEAGPRPDVAHRQTVGFASMADRARL